MSAAPHGATPAAPLAAVPATQAPPTRPAPWTVLRHRDYRLVWVGQAVSGVGTFMQVVGQSLLVLELGDGSPVALGTVSLAQAVAFLAFSLIGGSVVDRYPKRRVLFVTQSLLMGLAAAMAVLTATGAATLPLVVSMAFVSGVVASFDQPARSSLLPHLVPRTELPRATALNALVMTAAGTVGPALAGLTASTLGLTVNFAMNAFGFAVVLACLAFVRTDAPPAPAALRQPLLRSVGAGLAVVGGHAGLRSVVTGYGLLLLLGPSPSVVLPLYAAQVLHVGGAELGLLFSAVGAGTVLASSVQAVLGSGSRSRVFLTALAVWAGALVAFASSPSLLVCAAALLVHGAARNVVGTTAVTLMQLLSPDETRGRVMSLNTLLANGIRPLGDFGLSAVMALTSVAFAAGAAGTAVGLYALAQQLRTARRGPAGV